MRFGEAGRHGRRARVAETIDVHDDALGGHTQAIGNGLKNPRVGLMRHEPVDVGDVDALILRQPQDRAGHARDRRSKHRAAIETDRMLSAPEGFDRRRPGRAAGRDHDARGIAAVHFRQTPQNPAGCCRFHQRNPCRITEENAGLPIGVVGDGRHSIGRADKHSRRAAALDESHGSDEAEHKSGARRIEIEAPGARGADPGLHDRRRRRHQMIGRRRADDDEVEVARIEAPSCQARARGGHNHRRRRAARRVALGDAGARANPCVAGVAARRKKLVRQRIGRDMVPHRRDGGTRTGRH